MYLSYSPPNSSALSLTLSINGLSLVSSFVYVIYALLWFSIIFPVGISSAFLQVSDSLYFVAIVIVLSQVHRLI
jgi:hypothetical protein